MNIRFTVTLCRSFFSTQGNGQRLTPRCRLSSCNIQQHSKQTERRLVRGLDQFLLTLFVGQSKVCGNSSQAHIFYLLIAHMDAPETENYMRCECSVKQKYLVAMLFDCFCVVFR
jgi:hypothetical protein